MEEKTGFNKVTPPIHDAYSMANEMRDRVPIDKAYLMFVNGREHNIFVQDVGTYYVTGKIALHKIAMLVNRPGRGGVSIRLVSPNEESHSIAPGEELLHSEPCIVPSKDLNLNIRIEKIDLVEDQWRPVLFDQEIDKQGYPLEPVLFDKIGQIVPSALCEIIPAFKPYLSKDGNTFYDGRKEAVSNMPPPRPISREAHVSTPSIGRTKPILVLQDNENPDEDSDDSEDF